MGTRPHIPTALRQHIITHARGLCEYCGLHQDDAPFNHTIDHVIALKHGGATNEENLALACLECNLHKGTDLTTFDPLSGELVRLFHPRQQVWRSTLHSLALTW